MWVSRGAAWVLPMADPGISPNEDGLPGLPVVRSIVGALLTWGLVACVAGLVVSVIVWALARQQGNYSYASGCKRVCPGGRRGLRAVVVTAMTVDS